MFKIYMLDKGQPRFVAAAGSLAVASQQAEDFSLANGDCFCYVEECRVVWDVKAAIREYNDSVLEAAMKNTQARVYADINGNTAVL